MYCPLFLLIAIGSVAHAAAVATTSVLVGPYTIASSTISIPTLDSSDRRVELHYPANQTNQSFPIVIFAHGLDNEPSDYSKLFAGIVSFGYIITSHHACKEGCVDDKTTLEWDPPAFAHYYQQQLKVIEWIQAQPNDLTTLPFHIDFTHGVGIAGHSMGGQATLFSSSDNNASTHNITAAVMHHAFTHTYPAPAVPFLAFTGEEDIVAYPSYTERFFYAKGPVHVAAKGLIYRTEADHFEPEDPFFPFYNSFNPLVAQYTAAWFKLYLENKTIEFGIDFHDLIYGTNSSSVCKGDGAMVKCEMKE